MVEGNPYGVDATLVVVESDPPERPSWQGIRAIRIGPDPKAPLLTRAKPRLEALDAMLATVPDPAQIALVEIDYDSLLTTLPRLERFSRLRFAHIAASGIRSYEPLYGLRELEGLFLVGYKRSDLADFRRLRLDRFRAIRGRIERLDLVARDVLLQACTKLTELEGARVDTLVLQACARAKLEQLPGVHGLRILELRSPKGLATLDWLTDCKSLRSLTVAGSSLARVDLDALCRPGDLRCAFLGSARAERIARIAAANPALVITNGDVTFAEGRTAPLERYYQVSDALEAERVAV